MLMNIWLGLYRLHARRLDSTIALDTSALRSRDRAAAQSLVPI